MRKSLFILALLLASCGGDGAGPSQPIQHVPGIADLKLTPNSVGYMTGDGQAAVMAEVAFADSGRDIATLCIAMPDGSRVDISKFSSGTTGTISEKIAMPTGTIGTYSVEVWLVDGQGDSSNHLSAQFEVVSEVHTSDWTSQLSGLPFALNDVIWNGTRFVAVGDGGKILSSRDGVDWVEHESGTEVGLVAVASRGPLIVAVGHDATVLRSTDSGTTWCVKHSGEPVSLAAVAITPSQVVVGGMHLETGNAFMMRSLNDGESWATVNSLPQSGHFVTDLVYAKDVFVAATDVFSPDSDARVMVSSDGDIWNEIILRDDVAALYVVLHDGKKFMAAGSHQTVFTSPDGYNWSEVPTPVDRVDYLSAACDGSRLVVAGGIPWWYWLDGAPAFERPVGLLSADCGVTWGIFSIDGYYESSGMAWGNGRFVSVGQSTPVSGRGAIYTSD